MDYPGFIGASYVAQSPIAANERCVNFYVERQEIATGKSRDVLYPAPGVTTIAQHSSAGGRGHFVAAEREFAVIGTSVIEISAGGTITARGTVAVDSSPVTWAYNGDGGGEVLIGSGNNGYILDLATDTLTQVRTGGTRMVGHLDGFFLALNADTSTLFISEFLDGTTWDPTQFAQRSTQSDPWVSMVVWDRYIRLHGTETTDAWYNAGTAPFPFAPHPSGLVPYGIAAPFSAKVIGGSEMWIAATRDGRGAVVRATGFTPDVVSTFPLLSAFAGYADLESAIGDAYDDRGHEFYVLTFPSSGTWTYDASPTLQLPNAMRWTERGTWISEENRYVAWRPLYHAFAFDEHRMLDLETGHIYKLTSESLVDVDDRPLRRLRRPPTLWAFEDALPVSEFELGIEPGLGLISGQGSDPQVSLRISTNAGKTFGNERWRSAGAMGEYGTRVFWTRCGSAKKGMGWQPEVVMTDPVPFRITGARLRLRGAA